MIRAKGKNGPIEPSKDVSPLDGGGAHETIRNIVPNSVKNNFLVFLISVPL